MKELQAETDYYFFRNSLKWRLFNKNDGRQEYIKNWSMKNKIACLRPCLRVIQKVVVPYLIIFQVKIKSASMRFRKKF